MRYVTQINASGHNDPTAGTLAHTIVMLAKQGERDPVRLEQRAIEIMSGQSPDLARSTSRVYVEIEQLRAMLGERRSYQLKKSG